MVTLVVYKKGKFGQLGLKEVKTGKEYQFVFEFQSKYKPQIGDKICMHENLLNPKSTSYSGFYSFGEIDSVYGRNLKTLEAEEKLGVITIDNKQLGFKRIYG